MQQHEIIILNEARQRKTSIISFLCRIYFLKDTNELVYYKTERFTDIENTYGCQRGRGTNKEFGINIDTLYKNSYTLYMNHYAIHLKLT